MSLLAIIYDKYAIPCGVSFANIIPHFLRYYSSVTVLDN